MIPILRQLIVLNSRHGNFRPLSLAHSSQQLVNDPSAHAWRGGHSHSSSIHPNDLQLPQITIIGRPNVGKSALFNKLLRKTVALVYDTPSSHVTRDYKEGIGKLGDLRFRLIDTSGLEPDRPHQTIQARAVDITSRVVKSSDLTLMVVDARAGLLASDEELAQWLRKQVGTDRVLVVANKAENQRARQGMSMTVHDCYRLGFGEPVAVSASTGEGMVDLYGALQPWMDAAVAARAAKGTLLPQQPAAGRAVGRAALKAPADNASPVFGQEAAQLLAEDSLEDADDVHEAGVGVGGRSGADGTVEETGSMDWAASGSHLKQREEEEEEEPESGDGDEEEEELEDGYASEDESEEPETEAGQVASQEDELGPLRMAILGQPNVGKSTLLNCLLNEQRALTGPEPGLTRDSVHASMTTHDGIHIDMVDTAGWVGTTRTSKYDDVGGALADMARRETGRALAACHVAVLVLDAERAVRMQRIMTQRELALAGLALSEGRALVVAANKIDVLSPADRTTYLEVLQSTLETRFLEAGALPVVGISALVGRGVELLLPTVQRAFTAWNKRVSTGMLNRFVAKLKAEGAQGGTTSVMNRIKYMTQVKARPPSFAAFMTGSQLAGDDALRFLAAQMRQELGFQGVPVRIWCRYKEARTAKYFELKSRRGRSAAMRGGPKTRQKRVRAAVELNKLAPATFHGAARNILDRLAGGRAATAVVPEGSLADVASSELKGSPTSDNQGPTKRELKHAMARRREISQPGSSQPSAIPSQAYDRGGVPEREESKVHRDSGVDRGSLDRSSAPPAPPRGRASEAQGVAGGRGKATASSSKAQMVARLMAARKPGASPVHVQARKRSKAKRASAGGEASGHEQDWEQ